MRYIRRGFCTFINPRRACAGGLRYLSCVCVCLCLSVTAPAPTALVSTLKMRYVGVYLRLFSLFNSWIFDKSFSSEVIWRQQANMQMSSYIVHTLTDGTLSKRSPFSPLCTAWMLLLLLSSHANKGTNKEEKKMVK